MLLRHLDESDQPAIHETFLAAFADYEIPVDIDSAKLERLMKRRGADLSVSVGAFDAGQMVGVMATAVREFEGILSAYDTFTGVTPDWRGQRLAGRMFEFARARLEQRGVRRFLLEVIETNAPAIRAYERTGFKTRRRLECYELAGAFLRSVRTPPTMTVERVTELAALTWRGWRDWEPSWQNSDSSLRDSVDEVVWLEARTRGIPVGRAAVVPDARDLAQLVVRPDSRRQGVATALAGAAIRQLPDDVVLRAINVDGGSPADLAFYRSILGANLPSQREMVLEFRH